MRRLALLLTAAAAGLVVWFCIQSWVIPPLVIRRAEKALEIKISGKVRPVFFKSQFAIEGIETDWDRKIRIFSGRMQIDYDLTGLWGGRLHLAISGQQVAAELLSDWASMAGGQNVVFETIFADLVIDRHGLREVRALQAESPSIQFRFGPNSNRSMRDQHEA